MLRCWNETPRQRPTFSQLREYLESVMAQGDRYLSFDIDEENIYYNVASFWSVLSEDEDMDDCLFISDVVDLPKSKSVESVRNLSRINTQEEELNERYVIQTAVKENSSTDHLNGFLNHAFEKQ